MALIRIKELREKSSQELTDKLAELEKEIHSENASVKTTGKPRNAGKYRELKRLRARILTIQWQKKNLKPEKATKQKKSVMKNHVATSKKEVGKEKKSELKN